MARRKARAEAARAEGPTAVRVEVVKAEAARAEAARAEAVGAGAGDGMPWVITASAMTEAVWRSKAFKIYGAAKVANKCGSVARDDVHDGKTEQGCGA